MMQIAICDDEKEIQQMLSLQIKKCIPDAEIIEYSSGEELLADSRQLDLLFLDIVMDERDGMETARELRKRNSKVILIFVTAMEEYVFEAFDVGAFHYLVKPFSQNQFEEILFRAVEEWKRQKNLEACLKKYQEEEKYIFVKVRGSSTRIKMNDIVYAEVFNRKITIHTMDGEIEYYGKMSELEKQAGGDFFRCHRAYLVHFKYVVKYDASTVYLECGRVLMSKRNFSDFVKKYLRYNQRMLS